MSIFSRKYSIKTRPKKITGLEAFIIRFYILMIGFAFIGVIFLINGVNPFEAYFELIRIAFFTDFGLSATIMNFIPLLLIGLGIAIPAKAQIDNIGAEGQFIIGILGAYWVAFTFPDMTSILLIPLMFVAGFVFGAIWALPIAIFRVKGGFKGADVVVSFLLVFPAIELLKYMIANDWKAEGQGYPRSDPISSNAEIPILGDYGISFFSDIHLTLFLGLIFVYLTNSLLFKKVDGIPKTKLGYEIEIVGNNQNAGRIAGINFMKIALITSIISGGFAGIAGVGHLAGNRNNLALIPSLSAGFGFVGIAVAWLGGLNPIGIVFSALLFGGLLTGNIALQGKFGLPATTVDLLNGTILIFVILSEFYLKFTLERTDTNE
ncbi:MAG: hypothetical protein HeimC2_25170 [Candidatus Heimdallarchaeota archaeon LC_2]|nr:MAG: hypothetical protein HeimC2_25170 [Candidatus Heimdallarchaeota archaeon LC_2]